LAPRSIDANVREWQPSSVIGLGIFSPEIEFLVMVEQSCGRSGCGPELEIVYFGGRQGLWRCCCHATIALIICAHKRIALNFPAPVLSTSSGVASRASNPAPFAARPYSLYSEVDFANVCTSRATASFYALLANQILQHMD